MLDNGTDIRHIQATLGYSQLSTTEIDTQISIRQLKEVHALTHPADRPRQRRQADNEAPDAETLLNALVAEVAAAPEDAAE